MIIFKIIIKLLISSARGLLEKNNHFQIEKKNEKDDNFSKFQIIYLIPIY